MFSNAAWAAGIVNHLWQSTVVVLLAWLLTLALRRHQARVRYCVWMAASLKFLLPFSLLASLGGYLQPVGTPPIRSTSFTNAVTLIQQPFAPQQHSTLSLERPAQSSSTPSARHALSIPEILIAIWLCGALFVAARWLRGWLQLRAMVRKATPALTSDGLPILLTAESIEPGVFGLFNPTLLLPSHVWQHLPQDQLRAIIEHEHCHIRRRDNFTGALHMLVETIFWFHPAVWWLERRLIEEREQACDEAVLQFGNQAEVYAESILSVCKFCVESPVICMSGITGAELKQRILRIIANQPAAKLDSARRALLGLAALTVLALPIISGLLHTTNLQAQAKPAAPSEKNQKLVATWQGTLQASNARFVVKTTAAENATLTSTFYNLSGRPGGLPVFVTTLDGSSVKLDLGFATYEGTLSADGNSIAGTWRQGPDAQPLLLLRATPATEWTIPLPPPPPAPMAADANPEFDVATIKPSGPDEHGPRYMFDHRRFSVTHVTLSQLVQFAYNVQAKQIDNAPDWFSTESYNIAAQPNGEGEPSIRQWQIMVRKLMADRFQLRIHEAKREMFVYALTLAKGGLKFAKSHGDPNGGPGLGFGPGNMGATNATMAEVAEAMQQGAVDRPVADQTGLTGRYDLRLRWTPSDMPADPNLADPPPDIFTAMQEQLGLKLAPTRAPIGVIVVDHVAKPTAN